MKHLYRPISAFKQRGTPNYCVQFTFNFIHELLYGHASTSTVKVLQIQNSQQAQGEVMCLKKNLTWL
jgi:hypothetical protein